MTMVSFPGTGLGTHCLRGSCLVYSQCCQACPGCVARVYEIERFVRFPLKHGC